MIARRGDHTAQQNRPAGGRLLLNKGCRFLRQRGTFCCARSDPNLLIYLPLNKKEKENYARRG